MHRILDATFDEAEAMSPPAAPRTATQAGLEVRVFELVYRQMRALTAARHRDFDDLVQSALERALKSAHTFRGQSELSTWTYTICYRTLLNHHRWYSRWLRRFAFTADGVLPDAPSATPDPEAAAERQERIDRLRSALTQLTPKRRAVLVLVDLEGLDVEHVARIVEAKSATVRTRLRDARAALATLLENDPYFTSTGEGSR